MYLNASHSDSEPFKAFSMEASYKKVKIMKKRKVFFQMAVFSALVCFGVTACNSGNNQPSTSAQLEKITITAEGNKKTLIKGDTAETVKLTASVEGVTWASSKQDVATVDANGLVTAVGEGSTNITATREGYRDGSISIKVELEKIQITASGETELLVGGTVTLTANKQGVTWESSDSTIASVNDQGVVTANKLGEVTISAKKQGYGNGTQAIKVKRPDPTATLHFEDADHYSADGMWGTIYSGTTVYGPGEESPVYERSTGNASDGTCIAYMDNGDTETLTFTSSAAVKAELVMTMAARSAVSDMSTVMDVKLNNNPIDLSGKSFAGGGDTNTFEEFSLGELDLQKDKNVLDFAFKASSPYFDDLNIYAASPVTIQVEKPVENDPVVVDQEKVTVAQTKTFQITSSSMTGLSYKSANESIATVDKAGLVTGVAPGNTTIAISKDGYKTIRLPVEVTEAEGVFIVSVENIAGEGITVRTSQNLTAPNNYILDAFPADAVGTLSFNAAAAGTYELHMNARASGGYSSTGSNDLATCMELKVNNVKLNLTNTVSGGFADYLLGEVTLTAGPGTIEIKCLTEVPTINLFKFIPKA